MAAVTTSRAGPRSRRGRGDHAVAAGCETTVGRVVTSIPGTGVPPTSATRCAALADVNARLQVTRASSTSLAHSPRALTLARHPPTSRRDQEWLLTRAHLKRPVRPCQYLGKGEPWRTVRRWWVGQGRWPNTCVRRRGAGSGSCSYALATVAAHRSPR